MKPIQLRTQGALHLYRAFGWEVIPIKPNTKDRPLLEWSKPTDPAEVDKLFRKYPRANVACVLGERSKGLACQDFEVEDDYLEYYGQGHVKLEDTTIVYTTPGGGVHVMAYSNNIFTKKVKVCEDHPLDVLGEGCMAVMPPSVIDGKKYETVSSWRVDLEPDDNLLKSTIARCSELGWTITKRGRPMSVQYIANGVPEGQRKDQGIRLAGFLVSRMDFDHNAVLQALTEWNERNKPPLPVSDVLDLAKSAAKYRERKISLGRGVMVSPLKGGRYRDGE